MELSSPDKGIVSKGIRCRASNPNSPESVSIPLSQDQDIEGSVTYARRASMLFASVQKRLRLPKFITLFPMLYT